MNYNDTLLITIFSFFFDKRLKKRANFNIQIGFSKNQRKINLKFN